MFEQFIANVWGGMQAIWALVLPYLAPFFQVLIGLAIGTTAPDIDLAPPLPIRHRSFWTHGPLLPLGVVYIVTVWRPGWWPLFWSVFLLGLVVHLAADMRPVSWQGGALIKLFPLRGSFGPFFSWLWITAGMLTAAAAFWYVYGPAVIAFLERWILPVLAWLVAFFQGIF